MTDTLTPSEAALLRVYAELGVPAGVAVQESILDYHWGRTGGIASNQELRNAIFALQFRDWLQPGPESFGNLGWELTDEGHAHIQATGTRRSGA